MRRAGPALSGYGILLLANLSLAGGYAFVAACHGEVLVWHLLLVRSVVYLLALAPAARRAGRASLGAARSGLLLRGVTGSVFQALMTYALGVLPLAVATLLGKTSPLWTLLLVWLLFGTAPVRADVGAIAIALVGVAVILLPEGGQDVTAVPVLGLAAAVAAGAANAVEFVTIRRLRQREAPTTVNLWYGAVMLVVSAPLALLGSWPSSARLWAYVLGYAVLSLVGQMLLAADLGRVTATTASAGALTVPVFGALIGWVAFSERLSALEVVGILLVLVAAGAVSRVEAGRHLPPAPPFRWSAASRASPSQ